MDMQNTTYENASYMANPMIRRLSKVKETSEDHATYGGIIKKCIYFMLTIVVGVAVALLLHKIPFEGLTDDNGITIKYTEFVAAGVSLLCFIACPIIATFAVKSVPVTGTLACVSTGYIIAFIGLLMPDYGGAILLALVLTFADVLAMQLLYMSGKIRVTNKFVTVICSVLLSYVIGGALLGVCYFIPGLNSIYSFLSGNTVISIAVAAGGVILATLFLLADFDTIHKTVENKLPKKYEWSASYSLCFTVIWLYFEILNLIGKANDTQRMR